MLKTTEEFFPVKMKDVESLRFDRWYPKFRKLTIRSEIIPLSEGFVRYVLKDGIVLPRCDLELSKEDPRFEAMIVEHDSSDEEWGDNEEEKDTRPVFRELEIKIRDSIGRLGGAAFAKVNWSSANDAKWVSGSVKCTTPGHVFLLLKSSDFVSQNLTRSGPRKYCTDFEEDEEQDLERNSVLVLRRWGNIALSQEFRCFVHDHEIIALSQRDVFSYYEFLESRKDCVRACVTTFFKEKILPLLKGSDLPSSFVMDVFLDRKDKVYLIDLSVLGKATDTLMFSFSDLQAASNRVRDEKSSFQFEIRFVRSKKQIVPSGRNFYCLPKDVLDRMGGDSSSNSSVADIAKEEVTKERRGDE